MLGRTKKWEERRKLLMSRTPIARIDRCAVTRDDKGRYRVEIEGLGLHPALAPPTVLIGEQELQEAKFEPGGRRITGVLKGRPSDDSVRLDLGYVRVEGRAAIK